MYTSTRLIGGPLFVLITLGSLAHGAQQPYSTWLADSAISRGQGHGLDPTGVPLVSYEHGTFQRALTALYKKTKNATYFEYILTGIDNVVAANGSVGGGYVLSDYILDDLKLGQSFIEL